MGFNPPTYGASKRYTEDTIIGQGAIKGDKGDKGDPGPQGPQGEKGEKGDPGSVENVSMSDLDDVHTTDLQTDDILMYNENAKGWVNKSMPVIPSKTSELTNDTKFQTEDDLNGAKDELNERIDEIELFKFPNAVIVGEPTINHGQISDFSATSYLKFPFLVDFQNRNFEITMGITTGSNVTTQENIFDSDYGLAFAIREGKFVIAISSNGTDWNLGEGVGTYGVQPNTSYVLKLSWNKLRYQLSYSVDDGKTFVLDIDKVAAVQPYPKQIFIGVGENFASVVNHFTGIINLNKASLKIGTELVWQGMDDVGLATRLAVDLENIDDDGIAKVKEIARDGLSKDDILDFPTDYLTGGLQTSTSSEDGGINTFTFNRADGTTATFNVKNGSKGSDGAQGPKGDTGATGAQGPKGDKGDPGQNATTTSVFSTTANGLAPKSTSTSNFLRGNGTWDIPASVKDSGNSSSTTFSYSKAGLGYDNYSRLAAWNGYELRAVDKAQFVSLYSKAFNVASSYYNNTNYVILRVGDQKIGICWGTVRGAQWQSLDVLFPITFLEAPSVACSYSGFANETIYRVKQYMAVRYIDKTYFNIELSGSQYYTETNDIVPWIAIGRV